jgi:hypothetical protein
VSAALFKGGTLRLSPYEEQIFEPPMDRVDPIGHGYFVRRDRKDVAACTTPQALAAACRLLRIVT